jgi:hypothetical protein
LPDVTGFTPAVNRLVAGSNPARGAKQGAIFSNQRPRSETCPWADRSDTTANLPVLSEASKKGGILGALLASPLKDCELDLTRPNDHGRVVKI